MKFFKQKIIKGMRSMGSGLPAVAKSKGDSPRCNEMKAGMTLLELLVVLGIFAAVSGIVLFRYGDFQNSISVSNLAQDAALTIRKAQSHAIGVRSAQPGGPGFNGSYGAYIAVDSADPNSGKSFILFADLNSNDRYDGPSPNPGCGAVGGECLEEIRIQTQDRISQVCVIDMAGYPLCAFTVAVPPVVGAPVAQMPSSEFLILFKRPNMSARLLYSLGIGGPAQIAKSMTITFLSPKGISKTVEVFPTGYIGVIQ